MGFCRRRRERLCQFPSTSDKYYDVILALMSLSIQEFVGLVLEQTMNLTFFYLIKCQLCRKSKNKKLASILEATKITLIYIRCSL